MRKKKLIFPTKEEKYIKLLEDELGKVLFENAMDKMKINDLEMQQGALILEVAMLKAGSGL